MNIKRLNNQTNFKELAKKIGATSGGISIIKQKANLYYFYIDDLKTPAANILKQDLLSIGGELCVRKETIACSEPFTDALILVNKKQLKQIIEKSKLQPFGLKQLSLKLESFLHDNKDIWQIMGVINANDDSFYSGSRFKSDEAIKKIKQMIEDGATIIDVGGVSSRPGSEYVGEVEEFKRVKPIIDEIYKEKLYAKVKFSLDSFSPKCLDYALSHGFTITNDITALENDEVAKVVAKHKATVVLMHKKGTTKNMQEEPSYKDVIVEVDEFFQAAIKKANSFGIEDIVLDVGIGFGKRLEDNLLLIKHLEHFKKFGYPLLVGASRKSMLDMITPTKVADRLWGTLAIHQYSLESGASIIRCHDVKENFYMIKTLEALRDISI